MIEFQNVSKLYGDKEALSNLNLQIENGEIMGLIGHNGLSFDSSSSILIKLSGTFFSFNSAITSEDFRPT